MRKYKIVGGPYCSKMLSRGTILGSIIICKYLLLLRNVFSCCAVYQYLRKEYARNLNTHLSCSFMLFFYL